jgi:hypothetical protein
MNYKTLFLWVFFVASVGQAQTVLTEALAKPPHRNA